MARYMNLEGMEIVVVPSQGFISIEKSQCQVNAAPQTKGSAAALPMHIIYSLLDYCQCLI